MLFSGKTAHLDASSLFSLMLKLTAHPEVEAQRIYPKTVHLENKSVQGRIGTHKVCT